MVAGVEKHLSHEGTGQAQLYVGKMSAWVKCHFGWKRCRWKRKNKS